MRVFEETKVRISTKSPLIGQIKELNGPFEKYPDVEISFSLEDFLEVLDLLGQFGCAQRCSGFIGPGTSLKR